MITREEIYDLINSMKPHTLSALRENQRSKLPFIMDDEDTFFDTDGVLHSEKCKISTVKKYHYKERWYYYKYSVDKPDETFGILKVENLPYRSFYDQQYKQSFIASIERMVIQNHLVPFMLFIDNKFVNWNDIDLVFDCGETYLLLHGDKYNWYNLSLAKKFTIVTLPFKVEYIGTQTNESFNLNLAALINYLQDSISINSAGKITINVPAVDAEYVYNHATYSIGAWLYHQIRDNYLGILSADKVKKLKNISLISYEYDALGNKVNTHTTRFNALDRDVYDRAVFDSLCHSNLEQYNQCKLFSFNDDGYLDDNGGNAFYVLTDRMYHDHFYSSDPVIYNDHNHIKNILQRENYLVFKDGLLDIDCEIKTGLNNLMRIKNPAESRYDIFTFYHLDAESVYQTTSFKFSQDYLNAKAKEYFDLSRRVKDGVMAILMDEDGNDTDVIINRLDTAFVDKFYKDYYKGIVYINEQYKLFALLMDDNNEFNGKKITGLDFGPQYELESIVIDGNHHNHLIAEIVDDESKLNGLVIKNGFVLIDPSNNDKIELLLASDNRIYAKIVDNNSGMTKKANASFLLVDPKQSSIEFISDDKVIAHAFDPEDRILGGRYVLTDVADEYFTTVLVNGGMYAEIFDRGGFPKDELFAGEFLLIDPSVDYGIVFLNSNVFAMTMNDDGTFDGKVIYGLGAENIGDSNIMPLEGTVLLDYKDAEINDYVLECMKCLDFILSDTLPYLDNMNNAIEAIINYDASIFNRLNHTNIESTVLSGKEANRNLNIPMGYETRRGLKIPRQKFYNHETFCMVFLNGELIEQYSKMIAYHDFFFIPIEDDYEFNDNDEIELMYFLNCDNNEIRFKLSDYILTCKMDTVDMKNMAAIVSDNLEELMDGSMEDDISVGGMNAAKLKYRFITSDGMLLRDKSEATMIVNKIKTTIFSQFIRPEDLKIFERYPKNIMEYPELIEPSDDIAFNISFSEDNETYIYPAALENINDVFIAVSKRKFIYDRLHVDHKSYRIKLGRRFRYCDNQKQYMLFINGRRIYEESFFITTPKYSRPFWGIYLYLTKFVTPEDRVEIFYVPEEMLNTNTGNAVVLKEDGYIEANKVDLDVPYDNRLYLFFINGKKINPDNLCMVSSNMLRMRKDTKTLMPLVINTIYTDTMPEVVEYMHNPDKLSTYDRIVDTIRNSHYLGKDELDKLFEIYVKMSDIEENMLKQNVGRIAVINEIVRDFWVTSGYDYNNKPFVYDYDLDEIIYQSKDGTYILPSLDANYELNIRKNETHLLYFTADPEVRFCERGSVLDYINFIWEYSMSLYNDSLNLVLTHQTINDVEVGNDVRSFEWTYPVKEDTTFLFTGNTGHQLLQDTYSVKFVDPIYYGLVDEDTFAHYRRSSIISIEDLIALVPKNGILPSEEEMLKHMEIPYILEDLRKDYYIFRNLIYLKDMYKNNPDYILIDDLIALIPDDWHELMDGTMDEIAEDGLKAAMDKYKWMTFDHLLLVDPNEEPIEWIWWLKAIIPGDEKDVMGYPDRLTSKDGVILMDDHIDTIFAITMREDGRYMGRKIFNLDLIFDNSSWDFLEFIDGMYAIKMDSDGLLTNDIVEDLTFANSNRDVIHAFDYIKDNSEWSMIQFIDDLKVITEVSTYSVDDSKLTFINTDMGTIPNLDFVKTVPDASINGIAFVNNEMIAFSLDQYGNETADSFGSLFIINRPDYMPETTSIVNLGGIYALTMNENGEFIKDLVNPPKDMEVIIYLNDKNEMFALSDNAIDKNGNPKIDGIITGQYNLDFNNKIIKSVLVGSETDSLAFLSDSIYANVLDNEGKETSTIIDFIDHDEDFDRTPQLDKKDKPDRIIDLYDYLLMDTEVNDAAFTKHLMAILANGDVLMTGLDFKPDSEMTMEELLIKYKYIPSDFIWLNNNEDPIWFIDSKLMAIIPADEKDVMGYPDRLTARDGVILMDDHIDTVFAITMREDGRYMGRKIFDLDLYNKSPWDTFAILGDGVYAIKMDKNGLLTDEVIEELTFANTDKNVMHGFDYIKDGSEWSMIQFIDDLKVVTTREIITDLGHVKVLPDADLVFMEDLVAHSLDANENLANLYVLPKDLIPEIASLVFINDVTSYSLDNNENLGSLDSISEPKDSFITATNELNLNGIYALTMDDNGNLIKDLINPPEQFNVLSKDNGKIIFVNTDKGIINNLDYIKQLPDASLIFVDDLIACSLDGNDDIRSLSIIDQEGHVSETSNIINLNGIYALNMNENGEFIKDLVSPVESYKEPIVYINDKNEIFALSDNAIDENGNPKIDGLIAGHYDLNYSNKIIKTMLGGKEEDDLAFLSDTIYANVLDEEGNETSKVIDLIGYGYTPGEDDNPNLDKGDRVDRIIYFDDYLMLDPYIGNIEFTKNLWAIFADYNSLMNGVLTSDSNTLEELAEIFKVVAADYLLVDLNEIPIEFLKWLCAIVPTNYEDLMSSVLEQDPLVSLDYLETMDLEGNLIYSKPGDGNLGSYSGFMAILLNEDGTVSDRIIRNIGVASKDPEIKDIFPVGDIVNIDDLDLFAELENGDRVYSEFKLTDVNGNELYISDKQLGSIMAHVDKYLQDGPDIDVKYPIGNHNYFIYAIPKYYAYNQNMERIINFNLQNLKDADFLAHTTNGSSPVYTSGQLDIHHNLESLSKMGMTYLGETDFTSEYGITQRYVIWRTNGYFTRIQNDYGVKIQVQSVA